MRQFHIDNVLKAQWRKRKEYENKTQQWNNLEHKSKSKSTEKQFGTNEFLKHS